MHAPNTRRSLGASSEIHAKAPRFVATIESAASALMVKIPPGRIVLETAKFVCSTVGALYERPFFSNHRTSNTPLLAPQQGGVAERLIKWREASADREAGVVFR